MKEDILREFNLKLTEERSNDNFQHENELDKIYKTVIKDFSHDYETYRKFVPSFLASMEENHPHSMGYSIVNFFELFEVIVKRDDFRVFDTSVMDSEVTDEKPLDKMFAIIESTIEKDGRHRLSEHLYDLSILSRTEIDELIMVIIHKMQLDAKNLFWDNELIQTTMMQLMFLRSLLLSVDNIELFYHVAGMFLDRISTSEFYQAGRDLAEEIIITSYNDGVPELGYFNSFRLYSNGSVHAALLYANLSMISILAKKQPYSEKYVKEIIWQGLKVFRNIGIYPYAERIYKKIPKSLTYKRFEKRSLDHTYFTSLLQTKPQHFPKMLLDYLHLNREEMFKAGVNDALPWLVTLYNVKRLYADEGLYPEELDYYVNVFEMIVPAENVKKYKDIIVADSEDLVKHLKESLIKLNETRNTADFLYDNEIALKISARLLDYSVSKNNPSSFLLAMTLKSDYSILFRNKPSEEVAPLLLPEIEADSLESIYDDFEHVKKTIPVNKNTSVTVLGYAEGKLFEMDILNDTYCLTFVDDWNKQFNKLLQSDYFVDFKFNDTIKRNGIIEALLPEEFQAETDKIIEELSFAKLSVDDKADSMCIIKDMKISNFPHNLFLDKSGDFIHKKMPVTNVLSTEWLMFKCENPTLLKKAFTKSIWVPVQSGDIPLNYLLSNIESTLEENSFDVHTNVKLDNPLSSDINIVCSHGGKNISETRIISQNDIPMNLESIIGDGKILIFFVCYSGSMTTEFFRNNVASMVKKYIAMGYEAVIAPFWALDVTVPRYWLPEFLDSLKKGSDLAHAVHNANMKVYERYPVPAAWACLHLYGNPNVKFEI